MAATVHAVGGRGHRLGLMYPPPLHPRGSTNSKALQSTAGLTWAHFSRLSLLKVLQPSVVALAPYCAANGVLIVIWMDRCSASSSKCSLPQTACLVTLAAC